MTRSSKTAKVKPAKETEPQNDKWVFILDGVALEDNNESDKDATIVNLKHPQTSQPSLFLFSGNDETVQEILTFSEDKRSWFIDNDVVPGDKINLTTPIDPLFLILPYLKAASRCSPLDQILVDDAFPETHRLLRCSGLKHIHQIADRRGDESLNAYTYNEDKTLLWLKKKVDRIADGLQSRGVNVASSTAVSANFVKSSASEESRESYLKYAHGIISEYLPHDLSQSLAKYLQLPVEIESNHKRKKEAEAEVIVAADEQDNKRFKVEETPPKKLTKTPTKPEKLTLSAKDKARAKAASGSKNISSFFKKM